MPDGLYETIDELIAEEKENAARYCFDEAWISHLENSGSLEKCFPEINDALIETKVLEEGYTILACFPGINKALHEKGDACRSIATACAAFEISKHYKSEPKPCASEKKLDSWFGYASDWGAVQKGMYGRLIGEVDTCKSCKSGSKCGKHSKDLMTNFGYTFRILFKLIENLDESEITGLGRKAYYGRAKPTNASLCSDGFWSFIRLISNLIDSGESRQIEGLRSKEGSRLIESLGRFARCSSMLGNFCCIPSQLPSVDIPSLNIAKGGVRDSLFVHDDEGDYRVNDQFALFVEWLDENASEEDRDATKLWKKEMLLKNTWDAYRDAAKAYKKIFTEADRISAICDYLSLVSEAIENRSREIVNELKPQDK